MDRVEIHGERLVGRRRGWDSVGDLGKPGVSLPSLFLVVFICLVLMLYHFKFTVYLIFLISYKKDYQNVPVKCM